MDFKGWSVVGRMVVLTLSGKIQVERQDTTFETFACRAHSRTLSLIRMLSRRKVELAFMLLNRPPTRAATVRCLAGMLIWGAQDGGTCDV